MRLKPQRLSSVWKYLTALIYSYVGPKISWQVREQANNAITASVVDLTQVKVYKSET